MNLSLSLDGLTETELVQQVATYLLTHHANRLRGADGADGADGVPGATGKTGKIGKQGNNGERGHDGKQGEGAAHLQTEIITLKNKLELLENLLDKETLSGAEMTVLHLPPAYQM